MSVETLRKEFEEKRLQMEQAIKDLAKEERKLVIKDLSEYNDDEKIKFFDRMYKSCLSQLEEKENSGYSDEDNSHYTWEEVMPIIARNQSDFWKYWNSLD